MNGHTLTDDISSSCSARLRQALGIGPSDIAPHVTRMCLLGYPPGYKLQAEEKDLLLYHNPNAGIYYIWRLKVVAAILYGLQWLVGLVTVYILAMGLGH